MPVPTAPRDSAIDLVRALCITGVVMLHALMVGVTVTPDGPVFANAGETGTWLLPVSWALQVMPLFFVIGGFTGLVALRRTRMRGADATAFVSGRLHRLLVPAIVAVAGVGTLLAALAASGVDPTLVEEAGYRFGQPLWFLGVFLVCQSLLPVMARCHDAAPLRTLAMLGAAAVAVDVIRAATGMTAIGFANLLFVWLTMQQLGFVLADGRIDALSRRVRMALAGTALVMLALSFMSGVYSPDLVANINPPTTALILVGVVHTMLFSLTRSRLERLASRPSMAEAVAFVSERAMTIYLWHMPVLLVLAGVTAVVAIGTGTILPTPDSPTWWATRPPWLLAAAGGTMLVTVPLARVERMPPRRGTRTASRAAGAVVIAAVLIAAGAVAMLLTLGVSPLTAGIATLTWLVALWLPQRRSAAGSALLGSMPKPPARHDRHDQQRDAEREHADITGRTATDRGERQPGQGYGDRRSTGVGDRQGRRVEALVPLVGVGERQHGQAGVQQPHATAAETPAQHDHQG